jgi:hypothetical protein
MRILGALGVLLLVSSFTVSAQHRGGRNVNPTPYMTGSFGNVVFPGGTAATGVRRTFGNVVFPGGGGPRLVVPGAITDPTFAMGLGNTIQGRNAFGRGGRGRSGPVYAFPVYPDFSSYYGYPAAAPAVPPEQQQPQNVVVVYPPQPAPVIINPYDSNAAQSGAGQPAGEQSNFRMYQAPYNQPAEAPAAESESTHYLFAFKDHTIYSAVAYWVEGDTLHYFTAGNKHNQASLSLLDRDLTNRLNRESGVEFKLPR